MSSPASLPKEIHRSAERGELQKVVKWLRKGGLVDALGSTRTRDGRPTTYTLLLAATISALALVHSPPSSRHRHHLAIAAAAAAPALDDGRRRRRRRRRLWAAVPAACPTCRAS